MRCREAVCERMTGRRTRRLQHRPIVRWWWPRADVDAPQIWEEVKEFVRLGFGGVEVQAFSLGLPAEKIEDKNQASNILREERLVGTPHYSKMLLYAQRCCARLGMTFHCTCSSGWPLAVINTRHQEKEVVSTAHPIPHYRPLLQKKFSLYDTGRPAAETRISPHTILQDTRREPIGNSLCCHSFVADHLSTMAAVEAAQTIKKYIVPFCVTGNVLIDSFELVGHLPYTESFSVSFRRRYGYDILPFLHQVIKTDGENKYYDMLKSGMKKGISNPISYSRLMVKSSAALPTRKEVMSILPNREFEAGQAIETARVRRDYEEHRSVLFLMFLRVLIQQLRRSGQTIRLQAHGGFSHCIDAYALADVAETETLFAGGSIEFMRMASSASDLRGGRASCECLIMIGEQPTHSSLKRLIHRTFAAGIEVIVFHGASYRISYDTGLWYPFSPSPAIPIPLTTDLRRRDDVRSLTRICSDLSKCMSAGRPTSDILWVIEADAYQDRVCISSEQCRPFAGETEAGRMLRLAGVSYLMVSIRMFSTFPVRDGSVQTLYQAFKTVLVPKRLERHPLFRHAARNGVLVCTSVSEIGHNSLLFPFAKRCYVRGKQIGKDKMKVLIYNDSDVPLKLNPPIDGVHRLLYRSNPNNLKNIIGRRECVTMIDATEILVVECEMQT